MRAYTTLASGLGRWLSVGRKRASTCPQVQWVPVCQRCSSLVESTIGRARRTASSNAGLPHCRGAANLGHPKTLRSNASSREQETDVTIVGGGPVGLTLALLLGRHGIRSIVLDRLSRPTEHPQAHFIHQSAVEVLRQLGLEQVVRGAAPPTTDWSRFVYCGGMTGPLFASDDHRARADTYNPPLDELSPCDVVHIAQNKLVRILREAAQQNEHITLCDGVTVNTLTQRADSVRTTGTHTDTGQAVEPTIDSKFVVGADGASSTVRDLLGVRLDRGPVLQHLLNVHFSAPSLQSKLCARGMLYFVYNRETVCVIVAHDLDAGEYVAQIPYFPPFQQSSDFTIDVCHQLVCSAIDANMGFSDCNVLSVQPWRMSTATTSEYSRGRVFIAGDACHQFPPSGAFGMNTGILDAHNLAWKLVWAFRSGGASILDSYTTERQPVALETAQRSLENYKAVLDTGAVIGADVNHLEKVLAAAESTAAKLMPESARSRLVRNAIAIGRSQFDLLRKDNPVGRLRLQRLQSLLNHGQGLQLVYPEHDLGQVYSCRLIDSLPKSVFPQRRSNTAELTALRNGSRFPHRSVRHIQETISTIDFAGALEACQLLLFTWGVLEKHAIDTYKALRIRFPNIVMISCDNFGEGAPTPQSNRTQFTTSSVERSDVGAVLIRPDNVVAWHTIEFGSDDHERLATLLKEFYKS